MNIASSVMVARARSMITHASKLAITALCASSLSLAPASAQTTSSCGSLESQELVLEREMLELLTAYPGTHIVIGFCGAVASDQHNRSRDSGEAAATFGVCATFGCAVAGFENCMDVALRWFSLGMQMESIADRKRKLGCR